MARIRSTNRINTQGMVNDLVDELSAVLGGADKPGGPVIFEVAQGDTDYIQVVVVWEQWADLSADVRSRIVMDAYEKQHLQVSDEVAPQNISLVLPVTANQAIEMNILPYSIQSNIHRSQDEYNRIKSLIQREGAIETPNGMELRLPTLEMAREAHHRLQEATNEFTTEVHWQISEQVGRIFDYN